MSEFIGLVCIFIMLILTAFNLLICQFDSWELFVVHMCLMLFIPLIFLNMFDSLYFEFAKYLMYLLLIVNVYCNFVKSMYLYSIKDMRNEDI